MGRKAGVPAEETMARLLGAAARVFARRGYDGASISAICQEAGLTSGAVYAHYASKAELFVATLGQFISRDIEKLFGPLDGPERSGGDASSELFDRFVAVGSSYDSRHGSEEMLVVSAVAAARTHPEVAELLLKVVAERESVLTGLLGDAQRAGVVATDVSAAAISRLSLVVALGSMLVGALSLEAPDHQDWTTLMTKLVAGFRAEDPPFTPG